MPPLPCPLCSRARRPQCLSAVSPAPAAGFEDENVAAAGWGLAWKPRSRYTSIKLAEGESERGVLLARRRAGTTALVASLKMAGW